MAETLINGLIPVEVAFGSNEVQEICVGDTLVWARGAGYYDCGYGCSYYNYPPGCSSCNPSIINYYLVDAYNCAGGCTPIQTGINISVLDILTINRYYWDSTFTNFYRIISTTTSGTPITLNDNEYTTCNNALNAFCG